MNDAAGNSIKAESTREILEQEDAGPAGCLINTNYDQGPKVPKKRETVILDDSESEASSQGLNSDDKDLQSDKQAMKIDRQPTKRVKPSAPAVGHAYNTMRPILPNAQSSSQNFGEMISAQDLVKALDKKKTYFSKLSSRNTEYIRMHNKSIRDGVPRNINPALQDILDQSCSKADLPGELRAALRDKCMELHLCINLAPLDEKFCERLMTPAQSHEEAMITDLKDISGRLLVYGLRMSRNELYYCQRSESWETPNHESAIRHGQPRMDLSTYGKKEVRVYYEIPGII